MAVIMRYCPSKKCIRLIQLTTAFSSIFAAMFALWYLSIAFDELRKRFGWRSFSDIFSSNAVHKPITNTDNTKEEIKPTTPEEAKPATPKPVEIPKPEPPKFDPPKPKSPQIEKKPEIPKPVNEFKPAPKLVPKSPDTPKLPELSKAPGSPKLPEIPKLPDLPISKPFNNAPEKSVFEKHTGPKTPNEDSFTFLEKEKDILKPKPSSPKVEEKKPEIPKPVEQPKFTPPKPFEKPTTPKTPESPKPSPPTPSSTTSTPITQNVPKFPTSPPSKPPPVFKNDFKSAEDRENSVIFNKPASSNNGDGLMGDSFTFIDDSPPSRPSAKDATNSFLSGELAGSTGPTQPKKYDHSNSSAL